MKFMSEMVASLSRAVYFIRHRPHAKPEKRLYVSTVFMTDMTKLIRAFGDWANVLKHLVGGRSASSFDVEWVHPATTCLETALTPRPSPMEDG